mgnify:FL=1
METQMTYQTQSNIIESVVIGGDLSRLTAEQRVSYYKAVCESLGLNPLTRPFDYITLNGKLTLYARKDAADQLRRLHGVSIDDVEITEVGDTYSVKVKGHDKTGRSDVEIGVVSKKDMQGNSANVQMKAVTKAKRRLTLSLCGLGMLDETEIETIRDAQPVLVDDNGVIEPQPAEEAIPAPTSEMALEFAESELNSKGVRYGDLDSDKLRFMHKALSSKEPTEEIVRKLTAIRTILAAREAA